MTTGLCGHLCPCREGEDIESKKLALLIAQAALEKKAEQIVIMDMQRLSGICDYFVVASAESSRKVKAVAEGITEALDKEGIRLWHKEGASEALWVLLDYGDIVCHIFYEKIRHFYNLERLWADAPREYIVEKCISKESNRPYRDSSGNL